MAEKPPTWTRTFLASELKGHHQFKHRNGGVLVTFSRGPELR